ncbi:hypothetical protein [Winogradskyella endarachnes]|uniref:Uncharacterized protein n=1 Tax=Winogradskyella endarachnes TaxID=2681965 RepID=A0A6L6UB74_9FLAO|nr:hypothetical protein [Winogradskyella endarachnes]MUU78182.1 hypothetical protein [Winogradskyella endarachnes]
MVTKRVSTIILLILLVSCTKKQPLKTELITAYFNGFKTSNYPIVKQVISDSFTTKYGDYITNYTPKSFYNFFKWDSVFKPNYKLVAIENENQQFIATVSKSCSKFQFLKNNPMICSYRFQFQNGKISGVEEVNCSNVDWGIWSTEVETLVAWIKLNHPELDGFVHDLSVNGAQNYLKAIELYKAEQEINAAHSIKIKK